MVRDSVAQRIAGISVAGWRWNVSDDRFSGNLDQLRAIYDLPVGSTARLDRFLEHTHHDDLPGVQAGITASLVEGAPLRVRHRAVRADGQRSVISVGELISPLGQEPLLVTGYTVDLTEFEVDPDTRLRLDDLAYEVEQASEDLEQQQAWAQAKGALMALYRCDADWAWALAAETARRYGIDAAVLVHQLVRAHHGDPMGEQLSGHMSEAVRITAHTLGMST